MRKIKNPHLAQLLMQLHFTSVEKRRQFLYNTENLIELVDPSMEYPFDFVCFKITGYHPKGLPDELISGQQLNEDLRIFLWKLSGQVAENATDLDEKVYTLDELKKHLKISTRTLSRWRDKGLLARKYTFEDGSKRLAVTQSKLDKFINENPKLTIDRRVIERLTHEERKLIISKARKLAKNTEYRHHAIEIIANETKRSIETVRKVIADYQEEHPKRILFKGYKKPLDTEEATRIYKLYLNKTSIEQLMLKFNRSKSYIYRIIRRKKAEVLLDKQIDYIFSEEFEKPNAEIEILKLPLSRLRTTHPVQPKLEVIGGSLNQYLQSIKNIPRHNRQKEIELFRKYNFLKYLAALSQQQLRVKKSSSVHIRRMEKCLKQAEDIKNIIIESNLAIVVTIASKHATIGTSMQELISEGNFTLMKAVEGFDYTKGFRLSTYASWIIAKNFAKKHPSKTMIDKTQAAPIDNIQKDLRLQQTIDFGAIERARHSLVHVIKEELDKREQFVILHHYGLIGSQIIKKTKTLKEIGDELELTSERVRQIELTALQKLKQSLSIEEFELLTS